MGTRGILKRKNQDISPDMTLEQEADPAPTLQRPKIMGKDEIPAKDQNEDKENAYIDVKLKKCKKRVRKEVEWKLVGSFAQSPSEYIFNQLNSFIGWKSYFKSNNNYRYKCCQHDKGCKSELKITLVKDDQEDFLNFEIKVEISGEHTDHDNENVEKFITKRKLWGKILRLIVKFTFLKEFILF